MKKFIARSVAIIAFAIGILMIVVLLFTVLAQKYTDAMNVFVAAISAFSIGRFGWKYDPAQAPSSAALANVQDVVTIADGIDGALEAGDTSASDVAS